MYSTYYCSNKSYRFSFSLEIKYDDIFTKISIITINIEHKKTKRKWSSTYYKTIPEEEGLESEYIIPLTCETAFYLILKYCEESGINHDYEIIFPDNSVNHILEIKIKTKIRFGDVTIYKIYNMRIIEIPINSVDLLSETMEELYNENIELKNKLSELNNNHSAKYKSLLLDIHSLNKRIENVEKYI